MRIRYLIAVVCAATAATAALAAPAEKPEPKTDPIRVTVVSVSGSAHKLRASDPKASWKPLEAGDVLDELTVIRTGFRTKVELKLADRAKVFIHSGTKIGIREVRKKGALARTRLGLKYGSIRARVISETGPSDFQVATPVATLSVRGSLDSFGYSSDGGARGQNHGGSGLNMTSGKKSQTVGPGESTSGDCDMPIDKKIDDSSAGMGPTGQSGTEKDNINKHGGGRGGMNGGSGGRGRNTLTKGTSCQDNGRNENGNHENGYRDNGYE